MTWGGAADCFESGEVQTDALSQYVRKILTKSVCMFSALKDCHLIFSTFSPVTE